MAGAPSTMDAAAVTNAAAPTAVFTASRRVISFVEFSGFSAISIQTSS
jgi:hypothetical protein